MAFKLTYTDGQADDYDDATKWAVDGGVLKMGREPGKWTVLVSPSHWATVELVADKDQDDAQAEDKDKDKDKDKDDQKSDEGGDDGS
jgi:hypothetical protein